MDILTLPYANSTLCQNFKAIGEELSEISGYVQTNIYVFIYIDWAKISLAYMSAFADGRRGSEKKSIFIIYKKATQTPR